MVVLDKNDEDIRRFAGRYICINVLDCGMTAIQYSFATVATRAPSAHEDKRDEFVQN